ncbi:EamA family transporter [Microvirga terrestris]|uniref:EamA family transporter n=1 Tax=Microvirga terrestris TaxID=2791024 RepID=A0ABS0HT26_9HYPH|nr:EamA family transporter [Microvirga terrestris]MBF9196539.1 EamA family transporter [Microvirga terrestris]
MPLSHSLFALLVTVIWGLSFVVIKLGVGTTPPLLLAALRFLFAAIPAVFFVPRPKTSWTIIVAYGFFLGVAQFGLLFAAIAFGMPASLASVVMQAQVFFTILFAALLMNERPGPHQIAGGLVAGLGLVLIAWPRMTGGGAGPFVMTVIAAAAWGVANIVSKRAGRVDMLGFIVWSSLVAPLPLFGLSLWLDGPEAVIAALTRMDGGTLAAVAYLAYPTTIFAFGIWAYLLSRHPAATVTPFALFVPVAGILGSVLILGEAVHPIEAVGGAVIVLGLAFNVFGPRLKKAVRKVL